MAEGATDDRRQGIPLDEVNRLSEGEFVRRFGGVLEGSPHFAGRVWRERPFGSFDELHGAFVRAVREAPESERLALVRAHPDLAGKAAVAGELTPESAGEQASAGLDRLTPDEYEEFGRINREYRERFGFPLVVCVREHTKASILSSAGERLGRTRDEELETAVGEVLKIARLRLEDVVEDRPAGEGAR